MDAARVSPIPPPGRLRTPSLANIVGSGLWLTDRRPVIDWPAAV